MIQIVRAADRYHFQTDWLSTYWHFSFDHYYDPENTDFGPLRVFNDDTVKPAGGFPLHRHQEMEVLTYVLEGKLEHRDSLGNRGVTASGELQRMTAGTGIRHSEFNASDTEPVHFLQFWIEPAAYGLPPSWEQKRFPREQRQNRLLAVASGRPEEGMLHLHQEATVYISWLGTRQAVTHGTGSERLVYLYLIEGVLLVNGRRLEGGDQARISGEEVLSLQGVEPSELILLDLPSLHEEKEFTRELAQGKDT